MSMHPSASHPSPSTPSPPPEVQSVYQIITDRQAQQPNAPPPFNPYTKVHDPLLTPASASSTIQQNKETKPFKSWLYPALPSPLPWVPSSASPADLPPDFGDFMSNCALKSAIGVFGGGLMGLAMGVFLGAMSDMTPPVTVFNGKEIPQAPFREQARTIARATGEKSIYWCKNFAFITGVFSGSECIIEKYRGEKDVWNSTLSGCVTGAAIQAKQGPVAACMGCVGFAAFSVVIDKVME
jgi:import inner membrane translocase subunit TIM22